VTNVKLSQALNSESSMTSYEIWLLQVRMKTSYTRFWRERKINKYTHTQEGEPQNKGMLGYKMYHKM
jgi:hypothetical protein